MSAALRCAIATDDLIARDALIHQAAFDHIRGLQSRDLILSHEDVARGFILEGQRWPLWNPQRGIFKPRGMPFLLSIRTVFPRKRGRIWSDDQRHVHQQIFAGDDELDDAFMGTDPSSPDNVWLREAAERQIPLIYFLGVSPGRYQAHCPDLRRGLGPAAPDRAHRVRRACWCYCHGHSTGRGRAPLCPPPGQQRLHQASFRTACSPPTIPGVRSATYQTTTSSTPPTSSPMPTSFWAQPVIAHGIALSKIHHAAFDNHLIGIDPDGRVQPDHCPEVRLTIPRWGDAGWAW